MVQYWSKRYKTKSKVLMATCLVLRYCSCQGLIPVRGAGEQDREICNEYMNSFEEYMDDHGMILVEGIGEYRSYGRKKWC